MNISLILNSFYNKVLSDKTVHSYLSCYLKFSLRTSQLLYHLRPPWWQHQQSINLPGGFEGLITAAIHRAWVTEANAGVAIEGNREGCCLLVPVDLVRMVLIRLLC